jgi:HAD superfamily hydrolase (TIGR01509 family)
MSETRIHAVVFDLDGLLIDSEPLQAWAWHEYVGRFGAVMTPNVLNRMLGLRAVDAVRIPIEMLDLPVDEETALHERDEIFLAAVPGAIRAHNGARELIDALGARNIPLALATSGHRRYVDLALASAELTGLFDQEVTAELVTRGKPHPDVYLRAAELLHTPPAACLALEDAPNGVTAAKAAGMHCFAIPGDHATPASVAHADATLESLDDVMGEMQRRGWIDQSA